MMLLTGLPVDVLAVIVTFVTKNSTRAVLSRTCKTLHQITQPHVDLPPDGALFYKRPANDGVVQGKVLFGKWRPATQTMEHLAVAIDGWGGMWPLVHPELGREWRYTFWNPLHPQSWIASPEHLYSTWIRHKACSTSHGIGIHKDVICRCVLDAVVAGTHVPCHVSRQKMFDL
jgi:hypothetical protein